MQTSSDDFEDQKKEMTIGNPGFVEMEDPFGN